MGYRDEVLTDSPSVFMEFEEVDGAPQNSGTESAATNIYGATQGVEGKHGAAIYLSTTSDYAVVNDIVTKYTDKVFSVEAWVKNNAGSSFYPLVSRGYTSGSASTYWHLGMYQDKARILFRVNGTLLNISSTTSINDGQWHQLVMVADGTTCRLYIDGAEEASGNIPSGTFSPTTTDTRIGYSGVSTTPGYVDSVSIYDTALSADRVAAHFDPPEVIGPGDVREETLNITEDAYTSDSASGAGTNYGTADLLNFGFNIPYHYYGLLKIPQPVLAEGEVVNSARIKFTNINAEATRTMTVYTNDGDWSEGTVKHNNAPARTQVAQVTTPALAEGEVYELDISEYWDSPYGLALYADGLMQFYSSEHTITAQRPQVVYTIGAADTGTPVTINVDPMTASADAPGGMGVGNVQRLDVIEDTFVFNITSPNQNDKTYVAVGGDYFIAYLKFAPLTGDRIVIDATLHARSSTTSDGTLEVYRILSNWDESTVTGGNRPDIEYVASRNFTVDAESRWFEVDISGVDIGYGVALKEPDDKDRYIYSSEREEAWRPYAIVVTGEQVDLDVQAGVATASANMPEATVDTTIGVSVGSVPFEASAELLDAESSVEQFIDLDYVSKPMDAYAAMGNSGFAVPVTVPADGVMEAAVGGITPAVDTQLGVLINTAPATARVEWRQPELVNGEPIQISNADDKYYQRIMADDPQVWFRLNHAGTEIDNVLGGLGGINHGTVRTFNAPEGRAAQYFNGNAYIEQLETTYTNADETLNSSGVGPSTGYRSTLEFSFKTDKRNTFLMAGKDNSGGSIGTSPRSPRELYLSDGKIQYVEWGWNFNTGVGGPSTPVTGFQNLADGEWHQVVIKYDSKNDAYHNTGGVEIWIDGKFEIRRRQPHGFFGFPDFIGSRPRSIDGFNIGDLPSSQNFVGEMSEVVFFTHEVPEHSIPLHYYAFMGWSPIEVDPLEAFAFTPAEHHGRGNQRRGLYLYWDVRVVRQSNQGHMNYDLWAGAWSAREETTEDYRNLKVFTKGVLSGYRDPVDDSYSLIDLENDLNIEDYDVIMFGDWPDEGREFDFYANAVPDLQQKYERLLKQLRWANDKGIGLMVTNPRLAVDLGIIDRIEYVPNLKERGPYYKFQGNAGGLYDYGSAVKFPWDIAGYFGFNSAGPLGAVGTGAPMNTDPNYLTNKSYFYGDSNDNEKFRVRALIEGLTDIPSYMIEDAIFTREWDQWGWSGVAYKYLHRMDGLRIGDEFFMHGVPKGQDLSSISAWLMPSRVGRWFGYYAVPPENVKTGTVVTTFGEKHWVKEQEVENPYKDYATTIAIQPGEVLNGSVVGGKIFVSFTEMARRYKDEVVNVQILPGSKDDDGSAEWPYTYPPDTEAQREWEWSFTRSTLRNSSAVNTNTAVINMPDGTQQVVEMTEPGETLVMTRSHPLFRETTYPHWSMTHRGLWWVSERPEIDEGGVSPVAEPIKANTEMPEPTVTAQRDAVATTSPMGALGRMPKVAEDVSGDAEFYTLPATARATFTGFSRVISTTPMTAQAELVENFEMVHTSGEQVVLTLHGVDVTLYLKEEA